MAQVNLNDIIGHVKMVGNTDDKVLMAISNQEICRQYIFLLEYFYRNEESKHNGNTEEQEFLTPEEFGKLISKTEGTVRKWCGKDGALAAATAKIENSLLIDKHKAFEIIKSKMKPPQAPTPQPELTPIKRTRKRHTPAKS